MEKRTPELVTTAMAMLPPRPDASIVLVVDGKEEVYEEKRVFMDLLLHGRVIGAESAAAEAEAAAAGPEAAAAAPKGRWERAWRSAPLVVHDAGLQAAIDAISPEIGYASKTVATDAIGRVLKDEQKNQEHRGPVGCLWTAWPTPTPPAEDVGALVGNWLNIISARTGDCSGLRELVVLNTTGPEEQAFPMHSLPPGLAQLALGFFSLDDLIEAPYHLTVTLSELRLTSCSFSAGALSALITRSLSCLSILVLGNCDLSKDCAPDGFHIASIGLTRLEMWDCKATGSVTVLYAPRLAFLTTGVRPADGGRLTIDLRTPAALREMHGLMLYFHDLSFISSFPATLHRHCIAPLINLGVLRVCIQMAKNDEIFELLDLLQHLPALRHLIITRVDEAKATEELNTGQAAFAYLPCITDGLRCLTLHDFRAGQAEISFATHILAVATNLSMLELNTHPKLSPQVAIEACAPLLTCQRASLGVRVQLSPDD